MERTEPRRGWGGIRLAAELGLTAGVASAVGLALCGHAGLTPRTPREGVRLTGAATAGDGRGGPGGSLPPDLQAPFGADTVPLPGSVPAPTRPGETAPDPAPGPVALLPVHILPPPPSPPAPAALHRMPPVALGPAGSVRAPGPWRGGFPVRPPAGVVAPPPAAPAPPPPPDLQGPAAVTLAALNRSRSLDGLGRLTADAALTRAAVEHAAQIAAVGRMSHTGYVDDVDQQGVSWQGLGEVLGAEATAPDPDVISAMWLASAEHRPIVLGSAYTAVGVGWAQGDNGWWYVSAILEY